MSDNGIDARFQQGIPTTPVSRSQIKKAVHRAAYKSTADEVFDLIAKDITPFRDPTGTVWVDVTLRPGVRATWRVDSDEFADWVQYQYAVAKGRALPDDAVKTLRNRIRGVALVNGQIIPVMTRVYSDPPDRVILDLCDPDWRVIEVTASGWHIIPAADLTDVRMARWPGMEPLPEPSPSPDAWTTWRQQLPLDEGQWVLVVSWLLGTLSPGPYPILAVSGEAGSGKSTLCDRLHDMIDPSLIKRSRPPRDERDIFISASHAHVMTWDNLSGVPDWLSDALCALATGSGYKLRKNYTDDVEQQFVARKPIMLNGIPALGHRSDLRDRMLPLQLAKSLEDAGTIRSEAELLADFTAVRPGVLAGLLDAASAALAYWSDTPTPPIRLASFARWVTAAERADTLPWAPGTALEIIRDVRQSGAVEAVEMDPWATGLAAVVDAAGGTWEGTAADLQHDVDRQVGIGYRGRHWPDSPRAVSSYLRRIATDLRRGNGLEVIFGIRKPMTGQRLIRIYRTANGQQPSPSPNPSATPGNTTDPADPSAWFLAMGDSDANLGC